MRTHAALVLFALISAVPALAASVEPLAPGARARAASNCPRTTSYLADTSSTYRGAPLAPRKLNQLPPGTTYMAVYRRIDGCEAPLTMVEYRNPRRR
jgi:hypothetical protein